MATNLVGMCTRDQVRTNVQTVLQAFGSAPYPEQREGDIPPFFECHVPGVALAASGAFTGRPKADAGGWC